MKKLITLLLVLTGMVCSASATEYTIYFKPNTGGDGYGIWKQGNERYAYKTKNTSNEDVWVDFTEAYNGVYSATYDADNYTGTIRICRFSSSDDSHSTIWSQSNDLQEPTSDKFYDKSGNYWQNTWVETTEGMRVTTPSDYSSIKCYLAGDEFITNNYDRWSGSSSYNEMTYNNDFTYSMTVTSNIIPSATYGYKPVFNGDWIANKESSNWPLTISANGLYTINYTFNCATKEATATPTKNTDITTIENRYYLWDASGSITGNSGYSDNLMTLEGTTATLASTYDANLTKDTKYKFKVVQAVIGDGTEYAYLWRNNSTDPAGDESYAWVFTPTKTRAYNVTLTYNTSTKDAEASGDIVNSIYFIKSAVENTWTVGDMLTEDEGIYSGTISNWANKWFAIAHQDALNDACDAISDWTKVIRPSRANGGETNFDVDFANYTNEDRGDYSNTGKVWYVSAGNNNNITISFNSSTSKWSINPYFTRNISTAGYATFSSAYDVAVDGAVAWYAKEVQKVSAGNNRIVMKKFTNGIPARVGALLEGSGDVTFTPATSPTAPGTNLLVATVDETPIAVSTTGAYHYILGNGGAGVGFYNVNEPRNSAAGKAYLATTTELATEDANARAAWIFDEEGETTGIAAVKASQKMNGEFFNLAGQRVAQPTKGLYIVNGKKVIMK